MDIIKSDVLTTPAYYIDYIFHGTDENSDDNINNAVINQFGPELVMRHIDIVKSYMSDKKGSFTKYPRMVLFYIIGNALNYLRGPITFKEAKLFLMETLKSIKTGTDIPYTEYMVKVFENMLETIKTHQSENRYLPESVMTAVAPIVPYTQTVSRAQELNKNGTSSSVYSEAQLQENSRLLLIDQLKAAFTDNTCKENSIITRIEENDIAPEVIIDILDHYDCSIDNKKKSGSEEFSIPSNLISLIVNTTIDNNVAYYYIYEYIRHNVSSDNYATILSVIDHIIASLYHTDKVVESLYPVLEQYAEPSLSESDIIKDTLSKEYIYDKMMDKLMDVGELEEEAPVFSYDLDKLMAYIFNSRRYKTDRYTNSLFLNDNKEINGYTYLKDNSIMVCELNDNRLGVPVIDLADGYTMKLIQIDRDGKIHVSDTDSY